MFFYIFAHYIPKELRQMTYLLTTESCRMKTHMKWFMHMYGENRDAIFTEAQTSEPPPLDAISSIDESGNWAKKYFDQNRGDEVGLAFWRDEWIK
jgi:hypothetical protein